MSKREVYASQLARELDMETSEDYFEYIVDSLINGQRQQVKDLFNRLPDTDQEYFLINWLEDDSSYHTSTKNICIGELIKNQK